MADKEKNVVLNFKMDGQVQYAETLKEINAVMNTAAKEYKNHIAAMGKDGSATEKLAAEKKKLEIQMEGAQKRTKMLREQYEAMSKDTKTTTGQLTQMYGKLLDAEKAETSLQKSLDRVNEGLSDQAQEAREAQSTLDDLKEENKLLDAEQKNLNSSFKLQNAELGNNASEAEKLELAQKQLKEQMDLSERTVKNLERQLEATKSIYGENSTEVMQMETKLNDARTTIRKFNGSLDDIETSSDNAGDGLEELGKKMDLNNLLEATELLEGVTDKLFEVGQAAMDSALEFGNSQSNLQANLGLTGDEAEALNDIVDQVFRNGIVGSVDEATEAVVITKRAFEDLNNVDLENITNKVIAISERTGTDVSENIRAAEQMMVAFGLTGEEALSKIAAGYENGLDRSGDFTDTLVEYAPLFEQAGFSADEMLQIMYNGLDKGAMNTNLVADAVKELQIRMGDGSFEESLENFSKETENTFKKWKDGETTVSDVASSIQKDLEKMSPSEQQEALSAISTQFEDLGVDASASLFQVGDAFEDVNGKADQMADKTPGEKWQSSMRELQALLLPLGEQLLGVAEDILPPVVEGLQKMNDWFTNLPGPLQTFLTIFGGLMAIGVALAPVIAALAAGFSLFSSFLLPLIGIITAVAAAIAGIVLVIQNWGAITDWISEKWTQFTTWISEIMSQLGEFIKNVWNGIKSTFNNVINSIVNFVTTNFNKLKTNATNIFNSIKEFFSNVWNSIKSTVSNAVSAILSTVTNIFNNLKSRVSNVFNGIKTIASNVWNGIKSTVSGIVNGVKDTVVNTFNTVKSTVSSIWDGIKDAISTPIDKAKELVGKAIDGIKNILDFDFKLPKMKLPHFSLKGKLDLIPPGLSVPKLSVDWRAKGGIFRRPTIFGETNGRLQGAGEAGPEAVLPLNEKTLGDIGRGIVDSLNVNKNEKQPIIVQMVTPDRRVLAELVAEDVYQMNQHELERERSFSGG